MTSRRSFVGRAAAALSAMAMPTGLFARTRTPTTPPLNEATDETYWQDLRREFLMPADEAFFNTGSLGASPRVVVDAVASDMRRVMTDMARWNYQGAGPRMQAGYGEVRDIRAMLAALVDADVEEVALTANSHMGMNFLAGGLDLAHGDEVVVMEDAHFGGVAGWLLREKRHGIVVRAVTPSPPVGDPAELVDLFLSATTPRTRVWAIPHLTAGMGATLFPVTELCRLARERGILSILDGAQTLGHLVIDVRAMDCDAYFASLHKWLLAPVGTGMLYIRRSAQPQFWTTLAGEHWDAHERGMFRFMQWGATNASLLAGVEAAIRFHEAIGSQRIQERAIALTTRLREGLDSIPNVTIHSSRHPAMLTGTTIWGIEGVPGRELQEALWAEAKVRVRAAGPGTPPGVRQCCHIYTTMADVDRSLAATRVLARG